ncbi:unnamed protein product [Pleuronectes platessa]|uniref:Uncharacterized protein n=1 Tax=Pleuronectes platessa TaxID=8262 RepID=A0A9N7Z4U4_PLEPL|nr:unnamed protein product [Pleuronectes platessa]
MNSRECLDDGDLEFLLRLSFEHEECSGEFSGQTCSQQRNVHMVKVRLNRQRRDFSVFQVFQTSCGSRRILRKEAHEKMIPLAGTTRRLSLGCMCSHIQAPLENVRRLSGGGGSLAENNKKDEK